MTSGALVTARLALDANRSVFAIPGSTRNARAAGPNELVRRGEALLVTGPEHVLDDLAPELVWSRAPDRRAADSQNSAAKLMTANFATPEEAAAAAEWRGALGDVRITGPEAARPALMEVQAAIDRVVAFVDHERPRRLLEPHRRRDADRARLFDEAVFAPLGLGRRPAAPFDEPADHVERRRDAPRLRITPKDLQDR